MRLRFHVDEETRRPYACARGITVNEVEQVLAAPGEDRPGAGGSRVAIGRTQAGWHIRVVYVLDQAARAAFVITAVMLDGAPLRAYLWRRKTALARGNRTVTIESSSRGWREEIAERIRSRYEGQGEMTAVAEDEAAIEAPGYAMMAIPSELVPAVRELLAELGS
jgi:hypothetical protein